MTFSIITVTYNSVNTLASTIESLRSQSALDSIEYIVVDGGSTDGTVDLIKKNSDVISHWISEADQGIYDAMNKGLRMATGDWVGFLHADDMLASGDIVETLIHTAENQPVNAIYGNLNYVHPVNTGKVIRYWQSQTFNKRLLKRGWMPPHPTLYIEKKHWAAIGYFNTEYHISADYDFILRLFSHHNTRSYHLDRIVVKMRLGGASNRSVSNIITKSKEDYRALKRNGIGGIWPLFMKNLSKLTQFIQRQ